MKEIKIKLEKDSYKIFLGKDILKEVKNHIEKYEKIVLLTNDKVGNIYREFFMETLMDKRVHYFQIPDGEEYKNYVTVEKVYDFMVENEFFRNSLVISLGGGVVCDIGGFIASTYMRGIDFIQVPTSLLAMVDASIGGKVAINHRESKNLIGAFYQPKGVFIDIDFLRTLSEKEFASGMGEVIKHSLLFEDREYFDFLKNHRKEILKKDPIFLEKMIYLSCLVKRKFVTADEKEKGIRAYLNLGHTYGHALESIFKYKIISHGEGVAKGIIFENFPKNLEEEKIIFEIEELFKEYTLDPEPIKLDFSTLLNSLKKDKKNSSENIKIVSLKNFGKLSVENIDEKRVEKINNLCKNEIRGVIDIGTNSVRVFISEIVPQERENKIVKHILKEMEITSLGEGVNATKNLSKEAMIRTLKAIEKFYNLAKSYGACEVKAMATSAVRDAQNREEFLNKIKAIGVDVEVISGELEALLSFKAIGNILPNEEILIVDIGGGSTEITYGEKGKLQFSHSYNVGAVRVTEMFFKEGEPESENIEKAKEWIKNSLKEIEKLKEKKFQILGVAGTVTTHVSVAEKMEIYNSEKVHKYLLNQEQIEKNLELFLSMDLENRKKIPGLQPKRAPYVIAGTLILLEVLTLLKRNRITVSETDNLEGATMLLGRIDYEDL